MWHRFMVVKLGMVAESVEHGSHRKEILGRVKPMTYQIDTRRFLARCSALLGEDKDWVTNF